MTTRKRLPALTAVLFVAAFVLGIGSTPEAAAAQQGKSIRPVQPATQRSPLTRPYSKVLLAVAGDPTQAGVLITKLTTAGFSVDTWDVSTNLAPGLLKLLEYSSVMTWSDGASAYRDGKVFANTLANYADIGGGVVLSEFGDPTVTGFDGRITDQDYSPMQWYGNPPLPDQSCLDSSTWDPSSPLMASITNPEASCDSNRADVFVPSGNTVPGYWQDGSPFVAINRTGSVVGIAAYPGDDGARTNDLLRIYVNAAVNFAARPLVSGLTASPSVGLHPLTVEFVCTATSPPPVGANIVRYDWVWGDGTDDNATTSNTAKHKYVDTGDFSATCIAVDDQGRKTGSPPATVSVELKYTLPFTLPGASTQADPMEAFRMIGFPVVPGTAVNNDVFTALKDYFGGQYDPGVWRLFDNRLFPSYQEITNVGDSTFEYGKGFWIISSQEKPANSIEVQGVPTTTYDFNINLLTPGYHMIASPFVADQVTWLDVLNDPNNTDLGLGDYIYLWDVDAADLQPKYMISSTMDSGRAYWIYLTSAGTLHIPRPSAPGAARATGTRAPLPMHTTGSNVSKVTQPPPPLPPGSGLELLTPNGGERLTAGKFFNITWKSKGLSPEGFDPRVQIEISTNGGKTYSLVAPNVWDGGSYRWRVPKKFSGRVKIKITSRLYPYVKDISNSVFVIGRP